MPALELLSKAAGGDRPPFIALARGSGAGAPPKHFLRPLFFGPLFGGRPEKKEAPERAAVDDDFRLDGSSDGERIGGLFDSHPDPIR